MTAVVGLAQELRDRLVVFDPEEQTELVSLTADQGRRWHRWIVSGSLTRTGGLMIRGESGSVGFGLSVSRQLAGLMGGDLAYEYCDGESVFTLTLPTDPFFG